MGSAVALVPPLQQDAAAFCTTTRAQPPAPAAAALSYRPLQPADFLEVKAAHAALFPIDYEDAFFHRATGGLDRIWSCAAFSTDACGRQQLVGFITAKSVLVREVDFSDRHHMGLMSAVLDHDRVLYFLTLGVLEGHRHRGIASSLVAAACQHACETRCRTVFLHVIAYNSAALGLYSRQGFAVVARLAAFYVIATGRQPDPQQQVYDAFLCVRYVGAAAGAGGVGSPWGGALSAAWTPLRFALGRMQACVPTFRPPPKQPQLNGSSSSSHSSQQSSTACPPQQQMSPWQPLQPPQHYMQQPANGWEQRLPPQHQHQHQQQQQLNGLHDWGDPHAAAAAAERHKQQLEAATQHHHLWQQPSPPHQHRHYQQQQQRQPSSQHRMLHWMFNASSRTQQQRRQQQHQVPLGASDAAGPGGAAHWSQPGLQQPHEH